MKTKFSFIFAIIVVISLFNGITASAQSSTASKPLNGTWRSIKDESYVFQFYGDAWILFKDNVICNSGGTLLRGVLSPQRQRNTFFCTFQMPNLGFPIEWSVAENVLTIKQPQIDFLNGQWKKVDSGKLSSGTNPLVGTWKTDVYDFPGGQQVDICQIYADGTGVVYVCDLDINSINTIKTFTYDVSKIARSGIFTTDINDVAFSAKGIPVAYEINGDNLKIGTVMYKRE